MKLPRDLSGADLAKGLSRVGYSVTRQTGSHIRWIVSLHGSGGSAKRDVEVWRKSLGGSRFDEVMQQRFGSKTEKVAS